MKPIRYFLLGLSAIFSVTSTAQVNNTVLHGRSVDTAHYYMKHSYDVLKYSLTLYLYKCYFKPFPNEFSGSEVITFKIDSSLNSIRLNAVNTSLLIRSVGLAAVSFSHKSDTLLVTLDRFYQPGEVVNVSISYQHQNILDHVVYTNDGCLFTDTPPEGSRTWFPCWDRPSDKALFELKAKVPRFVKLGSNGSLTDSVINGDTLCYHWVSRDPVATYLTTITSKSDFNLNIIYWHKLHHRTDSIPVRFYYQPSQHPDSIESVIGEMTDFYSELFGGYPFEKIGFATLDPSFPWGGMENQTMINLTMNGWKEGLVCHEFAHQWFGDLVTCGTWADIWLNESFATYCESLWLEHRKGIAAYKSHLALQVDHYLAGNSSQPIYTPAWAIHTPDPGLLYNSSIIYYKGACVLHQLRYVMGDKAFFQLLKAYATDTNFKFKNAVTRDFIAKANDVSKTDLSWFFNEWLYRPNYPFYIINYSLDETVEKAPWKVTVNVSQKDTTLFYKMPLQFQVRFSDATDTICKVMNNKPNQTFYFLFSKQPDSLNSLVFDPYRNILLKKFVLDEMSYDVPMENASAKHHRH
jgi:aminopeptidase N